MDKFIYFDNNATTQTDYRVVEAMQPYFYEFYANASSTHRQGLQIKQKVAEARELIANVLGANFNEIVFTSGATEAINLGIRGVVQANMTDRKKMVIAATEHKAVFETCQAMTLLGYNIEIIPVDKNGIISLDKFESVIDEHTLLCAVMLVNNETGVMQDIKQMAQIAKKKGVIFFCDGTQAVGKIAIDMQELGVDLFCCSAHKFYGPKGAGLLYVSNDIRKSNRLEAQLTGGGHEGGLRSGTLNVPGIVGIAKAIQLVKEEMTDWQERIGILRDCIENKLLERKDVTVNGSKAPRVFNTTNLTLPGNEASVLIGKLNNISISNGSACSSRIVEPSYVLQAMGVSVEEADCSVRISLGKYNTQEEVDYFLKKILAILNK